MAARGGGFLVGARGRMGLAPREARYHVGMPVARPTMLASPRPCAAAVALTLLATGACPLDPNAARDGGVDARSDAGTGVGGGDDAGPEQLPCAPHATGVASVTEGETIDVLIACSTGVGEVTLVLGPVPDGATVSAEGNGRRLRWPTDLDDAVVLDLPVLVPERDEIASVRLAVADASLDPENVPPLDPLAYTEEYGLPVIFLSHEPVAEEYEAVELIAGGHRYRDVVAKLRGASSLGYPKRSVTVRLHQDDRFQLPARGFADRKKIVLISTFDDNSYVRQRLAYQLYDRTDGGAPHTTLASTSVVLYLDGAYVGLYTLADHVDRELFEETLGLGDGGNLYKSIDHNANFRRARFPPGSGDKDFLGEGWVLRDEPELPVGQWDDLAELVAFADDADAATFDAELAGRISVEDLRAWWIFATAILGEDSYGKNAYLYKEHASAPFRYAPWDFNHSFGQDWQTLRTDPLTPVDEGWPIATNQLWERMLSSTVHGPTLRAASADALAGSLSLSEVLALFDEAVSDVDASARKDQAAWSAAYAAYYPRGDVQDFDAEVAYTRAWIVARWGFLAVQ